MLPYISCDLNHNAIFAYIYILLDLTKVMLD